MSYKSDIAVFNWYDDGIIRKPIFFNGLFTKCVLNIGDTNKVAEKYLGLYRPINLFIFTIYNMG
jgi:hypothetical protein